MKYKCIIVAENEYEGKYSFDIKSKTEAFMEGARIGANLYGCGDFDVFTKDDISDKSLSKSVTDLIRKHLGE